MKRSLNCLFVLSLLFALPMGNSSNSSKNLATTKTNVAKKNAQAFESSFDLRHVGGNYAYDSTSKKTVASGGLSYVTPVKLQNPWGTCWAFGVIAAAETSILSELNLGQEGGVNTNLDLSERHLAWFAKNHIPAENEEGYGVNDVNGQDGEGMWYIGDSPSASMEGGLPFYGTSVFAEGIGVVTEDFAPYCGNKKMVKAKLNANADKKVYTENYLYYDSISDWENESNPGIKANYSLFSYSEKDDWSLDETKRFVQNYPLEESRVLPDAAGKIDAQTGEISLNEKGIAAIKSELKQGKAVETAFYADTSDPKKEASLNTSRYINSSFAHYTWDKAGKVNHSVCIVGWDDNYDASNFGQEHPVKIDANGRVIYKLKNSDQILSYLNSSTLYYIDASGNQVIVKNKESIEPVREENGSMSRPAGNGAWIVKNSWGAKDNSFPNRLDWGADGSGYFYLSYYDTSISKLETYDFAVNDTEKEEMGYSIVDQYDFLTADNAGQSIYFNPVLMANVFTAEEDMEITALSCETATENLTVAYNICLLRDDEDYPSSDDEFIDCVKEDVVYAYSGFHRQSLDKPVQVKKGQKYAVVVGERGVSKNIYGVNKDAYFVCANKALSERCLEDGADTYSVTVIKPKESYLLSFDDNEKIVADDYYNLTRMMALADPYDVYDNFSIKAYGKPIKIEDDGGDSIKWTWISLSSLFGGMIVSVGLFLFLTRKKKEE